MKTRSIVYSKSHRRGIRGISAYSKGIYTGWLKVFLLRQQVTGTREWLPDAQLTEFKRHPAIVRLQSLLIQYGSDWLRLRGQRVVQTDSNGVKTLRLDDWVSAAEAEIARRMNRSASQTSPIAQASTTSSADVSQVQERNGRPDEPE